MSFIGLVYFAFPWSSFDWLSDIVVCRKVLEFSLRNSSRRIPGQIRRQQKPSYLSSRKEFSTASPQNASPKPGTASKPPESGNSFSKVVIGGIAVGAAVLAAHQAGYLDQILHKEKQDSQAEVGLNDEDRSTASQKAKPFSHKVEEKVLPSMEVRDKVSPNKENVKEKGESHSIASTSEALHDRQNEILPRAQDKSETAPSEDKVLDEEKLHASSIISNDHSTATIISAEEKLDRESPDAKISVQPSEAGQVSHASTDGSSTAADTEVESPVQHILEEDRKEDSPSVIETATPLLDAYHLRDKDNEKSSVYLNGNGESEKAFASAMEELGEAAASKDGKLILDFLQAIHAAELRQAELDARAFTEEKKAMKEKYEKELKDAIARELMHAEEAALLDKELKRERAKAAAAIKSLQQKLEEKHKMELAEKEKEAELKLKKVEELSKAEMSAAIAREKASQVEKMAEANLHGALALEDALSKGLPIKVEIEALRTYLNGIDKDSVLDLVLSSLPEETIDHGTDTFDTLKGTLRHFSLIPPGGGGILAHSLAHIASWLKVREANYSGNGIESVISQVESYLAEGKLAEAADALEEGVKDSRAVEVISSWVKQARNRAIAEQALTLLQSYATSISLT
ncbi:hypothetical protein CDL15_Pgr001806 [Punica granatum]|uniref:MICOS complex subunit MIC60 n=1 Tax=Punica granatum TaxID=22663 RepID=A0A218XD00_PUNGR|nr:hypothetical protein CDL15_Pgr001806 [Punica granatum]